MVATNYSLSHDIRTGRAARLLEPVGNIPPAEAEARYDALNDQAAMAG
jgi:hypothetical protein